MLLSPGTVLTLLITVHQCFFFAVQFFHNEIQLIPKRPSLNIFIPITDFISQQWQAANFFKQELTQLSITKR